MTDKNKPLKIEFAPGCFDHFEGTQEELDELIADITKAVQSGEILEMSTELNDDEFEDLPDEIQLQLINSLENLEDTDHQPKRKLQ